MANEDIANSNNDARWHIGLRIGVILTVVILVGALVYMYCSSVSKWWDDPEKFGTFLAGVSSALAFLWLVIATFLQMDDLKVQRRELISSREAQQQQAKETEALVKQNTAAVAVAEKSLAEQRKANREERIDKQIDMLGALIEARTPHVYVNDKKSGNSISVFGNHRDIDNDERIRRCGSRLQEALLGKDDWRKLQNAGDFKLNLMPIQVLTSAILKSTEELKSDILTTRVEMIALRHFRDLMAELFIWLDS